MDWVIRGFDTCLRHVHPNQLEAAEAVCGIRLCRRGDQCRQYAISWSDPPACKNHLSGVAREIEFRQLVRYQIEVRQAEIMGAWFCYRAGDRSPETLRELHLTQECG